MSDVLDIADGLMGQQKAARVDALQGLTEDPEQAARALELGNATGTNPAAIYGNVEEFEQNHRAALTNELLKNNHHLIDYANSHPLATKVSSDDWYQLDASSQANQKIGNNSLWEDIVKSAHESITGLTDAPGKITGTLPSSQVEFAKQLKDQMISRGIDPVRAEQEAKFIEARFRRSEAVQGALFALPMLLASPVIGSFRHFVADPIQAETGFPAETTEGLAMAALGVIGMGMPWLRARKEPPPGVSPEIDKGHAQQAKIDIGNLDDALKEAQSSQTRERSPEMFKEFVKQQVGERTIGISADAIKRIYGDKEPLPEDNILGWVPNIGEQLRVAAEFGGDVEVPLADWLAKVDPEVAKELHDSIRVRGNGVTLEEAKAPKPLASMKEAAEGTKLGELEPEEMADLQKLAANDPDAFQREQTKSYKGAVDVQKIKRLVNEDSEIMDLNGWKKIAASEGHLALDKPNGYAAARAHSNNGKTTVLISIDGRRTVFHDGEKVVRESREKAPKAEKEAPIVQFRRDAQEIERNLPPVEEGLTRLWRGNREGEVGQNPQFTNDLAGIALPFRKSYGGPLSYIDIPTADLEKYVNKGVAATNAEFILPKELATQAKVTQAPGDPIVRSIRSAAKLDSLEEALQKLGEQMVVSDKIKPLGGFDINRPSTAKIYRDTVGDNPVVPTLGHTTLKEALSQIDARKIDGPISPFLTDIMDRLAKVESNVPVHVLEQKDMEALGQGNSWGFYDPINHQIVLGEDAFTSHEVHRVLVHEGIHAATARLIDTNPSAKRIVRSIMDEAISRNPDLDQAKAYGFTNEHEFLTEALTKDYFQDRLLRTKISPELAKALGLKEWRNANAWQALVQWIRQLFKLPEEHATALEAALRAFDVISEKDLLPEEKAIIEQWRISTQASMKEPELPGMTRMEDRQVFEEAKAIGMNVAQYKRYQELIAQRAKEDAEFAKSQALKDEERRQSKEWKENENKMWDEVVPEMEARPDFAADAFLREGRLYGDKLKGRPRLDWESLTPEERAMLPPDFVTKKGGMSPDDVAGLFGYDSGKTLLDNLTRMEADRRDSGLGPKQQFNKVVEAEVERRMQARFGDLGENILKAAQEHVVSQTQLDLLAEEVIHLGTLAGSELPIKKDELKAWAKGAFGKQQAGGVSLEKLLRTAGNNGKQAELFLLEGKPREAFQWKQRQYLTMLLADEAKRFEKRMDQFDRVAKQFSKREVPSVEPEYTNFIHDILMRVGKPVRRSVQDLQNSIAGSGHASLEEFVQSKEANFRELPVAEFLYDPAFRKPVEEMTVDEFSAMHDSIKTLVKNGRDELKIIKAGDEADLNIIKARMIEQLGTFAEKHYDAVGKRWLGPFPPAIARPIRTYLASHLQLEGLFNRWDRGDPRGVFTQWIMRDLASAANTEAALERRFARLLSEIGDKRADLEKGVPNSIFMDPHSLDSPDGPLPMVMKRKNLRAILQNVGNESNLDKLARGYQVDPKAIMNWLNQHATKADWDWAQKQGDIFKQIKEEADVMYRHLTGVEPEGIDIKPIDTPHGTYPGWYHPIVYHPVWEGRSRKLMGGDALEQDNYVRATTPRGYTKQRTGYAAPLNLDLDATPGRMRQMIHDIAMRPAVINAGKIFYDKDVRQTITKHYGKEYRDLLVPYLRDVANSANFRSDAASVGAQVSEFFRQNIIATLIGFNPGTVLKHGPTAAINSLTEVGAKEFSKALTSLFSINDRTGETNWRFAMDTSEELQRRHRHYVETLKGAQETAIGAPTMRDTVIKLGAYPVAMSDLLSAVPTWLAKYESSMRETGVHGDAIYDADRAVRRAHGSSVVTNRPEVMRTGPMGAWFASLYGFFSHILNRQYELGWRAKDALGLVKEGEVAAAAKEFPKIAGMFFSYIIAPALIEELVTPMTNDEKESWAKKAAKTVGFGLSSSWIGLRDIVHAAATGHDPSAGLISTAYKTVTDLTREVSRGEAAFNRDHAGKLIRTGTIAFGALTGLANAQIGKSSEFIYNYSTGRERPKGPWQWGIGLRYGQTKGHTKSFEEWQHHVGKEWFGGKI